MLYISVLRCPSGLSVEVGCEAAPGELVGEKIGRG